MPARTVTTRDRKAGRAAVGYLLVAVFVALDTLGEYPEGRFGWRSALEMVVVVLTLERAVDRRRRWRAGRPGA
ncbi:hypothetical protein GCM10020369_01920 [Cryptosporangium minutisporangium]|uniref:Uncharacterized protein n=1 Tax=Cryptosporangium minutisporangium TaxID=113569 RepID=A0ABP6SP55_9ACTN